MSPTHRTYFQHHSDFQFEAGFYYQTGFQGNAEFIENYLRLRRNEGRLYDDRTVIILPEIPSDTRLRKEWIIRRRSTNRLIKYIETRGIEKITELGCGNGWLINYMSKSLKLDFCGVDINKVELEQASRLFSADKQKCFVYADINSDSFKGFKTDVFVLAGAVQYFPDLCSLINKLVSLLTPGGEIHILDSPFYNDKNFEAAKTRGEEHFAKEGFPMMKQYYFYQKWQLLKPFRYQVLYNPASAINITRTLFRIDSPFPWIKIAKA